jgi:L-threonylcarbamoyladenylate synthase
MREAALASARSLVLAFSQDFKQLSHLPAVEELGSVAAPAEIAARLYHSFREADRAGFERIIVRTLPEGGLGDAINDRLRRAASGRVRTVG